MTQAAASSSRNGGLFVPSREEAEELERALACGEGGPIPMMDKYGNSLGGVGHGAESDLGDLSLIDDHTLALAHDLMNLGSGAAVQNLMMNSDPSAVSNHMYMENLSIPHPSMIHPGRSFPILLIHFVSTYCNFIQNRLQHGRVLFIVIISNDVQTKKPIYGIDWTSSESSSRF